MQHGQRAQVKLEQEYHESFRVLPAVGAEHVIAEVDGTMICTVASGSRKAKRPREWKEMRLGAAAMSCRPSHPDRWRRTQKKRLRAGAAQKVIADLEPRVESENTPDLDAPVRKGYRYLSNRTDCLDYPHALALGLPIGSGMIESGHRHVLQARLKKAGAAWLPEHADQIAHLRVLRANHQWSSFWN